MYVFVKFMFLFNVHIIFLSLRFEDTQVLPTPYSKLRSYMQMNTSMLWLHVRPLDSNSVSYG